MTSENYAKILKMQTTGVTQKEAFVIFDSLETVNKQFMIGKWRGSECKTGHIMDGMLSIAPWYGKLFISSEAVHPLVFTDREGKKYCVDPRKVFRIINNTVTMKLLAGLTRKLNPVRKFDSHKLDLVFKSFKTYRPKARLREIKYRGKITAAMIYDELAIIDIFKKIDNDTIIGVMDIKGRYGTKGYFFIMNREK